MPLPRETKMGYKRILLGMQAILWTCVATTSFIGCGADESLSSVEKNSDNDNAFTSAKDLS